MGSALRVLNIEDSPDDAFLLQRHLAKEGYEVTIARVETAGDMKAALEEKEWDIILSDHSMPGFSAIKALALLRKTGLDIPLIIISGTIGEERAVEAMLAGASDYFVKGRLTRLAAAIERELGEARGRLTRRRAEEEMARLTSEAQQERERHEQRLQDQHFYTRSLIESDIDALITTDPDGIITDANRQMELLTGCSREELINEPFKTFFTDASRAESGIKRVLNEGKITNFELTARARDGSQTVVSCNATTFHDRGGRLQGVFAAARDITELKRFEQMLQTKNLQIEYASRLKSEFLANMSHELRTPLNAIIGFSEVLKDGLVGAISDPQREFISSIFDRGHDLLALINDILDLSRIEAGAMTLDLAPVQVQSLFERCLTIVRDRAAARHIRVEIGSTQVPGLIQLDPRKVRQIVINLLSNAIRFNIEGGQVTLNASVVPRADVGRLVRDWTGRSLTLAEHEFEVFLKISVTDSGIGIAPEEMENLFELFRQIDGGLSRRFEGTGLGLAMVKLLTELHGGTVAVESALGEGSCFTVWLPIRTSEEVLLT